ncbi:oxidoreductase [Pseudaminobacter sp. 19-2017]|uniref:Oxidoreductase n=1 Tax=Pseudaminobacter soli (ex Zhang et al. 2022) TaxID=2831468 RepID=A0A942IBZ2_9HYPH|nr:PDR/VanB family oxidoreductase [Pseudaminobacter soli]MBS3652116.1 oxidoreductase [Pseudaminobacter soli]
MSDGELEVRVRRVCSETSEIRSFVLEPTSAGPLPEFEAGAHIDVYPIPGFSRQYSLVNDPADRSRYLLGVKREQNGRGGSSAMHSNLQEGSVVRISRPKNNFALRANPGRSVLLAGGIGVTPLLSMAQALAARDAEFELHYFARSNSELAFRDLITESSWSSRVAYHFGLVPPLLNDVLEEILRAPRQGDLIYLCGPNPFMDVVRNCAATAGWPGESVILEHFSAEPPRLLPGADEFVVRLAKRGIELVVPSDKAIIDVLREAGIEIKTSCEQGVCGTCLTPVIEGEPEHNDLYLTDDEREAGRLMTPCVSRSKSKLLVLDM